ncbi:BTAD domain-containing putative transcriptional regulator [Kitasatospora sp. NPDC004723]|uniref:AfsR/SARP family transcriptional regulator n=1 Tax=Kitasatospora sp. NPDC004723 TaxID=3154288 RepID=UPI0033A65BDF
MRFRLLGELSVQEGKQERAVRGARLRSLLVVLLLHPNQAVTTDRLQDALWHDDPPASGSAALHNLAARLRKVLSDGTGTRLSATPLGYRLAVADDELDYRVFEHHLDRARGAWPTGDWNTVHQESSAALALWRGVPLAELPDLAVARAPREQWQEARLQALEWHCEARVRLGRSAGLVTELTRLVDEQPLHEAFHHQLMLALQGEGRRAEALAAYRRLRTTLREELGVEPSARAQEIQRAILSAEDVGTPPPRRSGGSPAPVRAPHHRPAQLPADIADFTGREQELDQLSERLIAAAGGHGTCLAVISGMGGIGKTALALHAAHRVKDRFPDGQLYVDLLGFGNGRHREAHEVLARFLTALTPDLRGLPEDTDDCAARLRTVLAARRVLLVLDNARDAAQILPLLPGDGRSAVLVTSRNSLTTLPRAFQLHLAVLGIEEQRSFLSVACGADRVEGDPDGALRVLAACAGLPLALRIAAARLVARPAWPMGVLAQQLEGGRRLEELAVGDLGVRASLSSSYLALRDGVAPLERDAARAFRLLGLWPGVVFGIDSASAVVGRTASTTGRLLELLVDYQLVQSPEPLRYRLHDLVGEFAAERAGEEETAESLDAAVVRLAAWYAAALERAGEAMAPGIETNAPVNESIAAPLPVFDGHQQALQWCVRELPHVKEAIRHAGSSTRPDLAWLIAVHLRGYASTHWWTGETSTCLSMALRTAQDNGDRLGQARLHRHIGVTHARAGRPAEAAEVFRTELATLEEVGEEKGVTTALWNLTHVSVSLERGEQALAYGTRALEREREAGVAPSPKVLCAMGRTLLLNGDLPAAEANFRRSLADWRGEGHLGNVAITLALLGDTLGRSGRRAEAVAALAEALDLQYRVGNLARVADCLVVTGRVHLLFAEWSDARSCFERALGIAVEHDLSDGMRQAREGLDQLANTGCR